MKSSNRALATSLAIQYWCDWIVKDPREAASGLSAPRWEVVDPDLVLSKYQEVAYAWDLPPDIRASLRHHNGVLHLCDSCPNWASAGTLEVEVKYARVGCSTCRTWVRDSANFLDLATSPDVDAGPLLFALTTPVLFGLCAGATCHDGLCSSHTATALGWVSRTLEQIAEVSPSFASLWADASVWVTNRRLELLVAQVPLAHPSDTSSTSLVMAPLGSHEASVLALYPASRVTPAWVALPSMPAPRPALGVHVFPALSEPAFELFVNFLNMGLTPEEAFDSVAALQ